jgi:hypothetical protein
MILYVHSHSTQYGRTVITATPQRELLLLLELLPSLQFIPPRRLGRRRATAKELTLHYTTSNQKYQWGGDGGDDDTIVIVFTFQNINLFDIHIKI